MLLLLEMLLELLPLLFVLLLLVVLALPVLVVPLLLAVVVHLMPFACCPGTSVLACFLLAFCLAGACPACLRAGWRALARPFSMLATSGTRP